MDHSKTTTAFEIKGYRIVRNLGVVRGILVRSRSIFGSIGASLQTIIGGNITIIGIRYESTEIFQGVTEVLCYGTAVVVEEQREQ
jgi:uncharacterized protein YbjQ (UPF0145 family)